MRENSNKKSNENNSNCNECLRIGSYDSIQLKWEKMEKAHKTNELKICNEYTLPVRQTHSNSLEMIFFCVLWCYEIGDVSKSEMMVPWLGLLGLKWLLWWFKYTFSFSFAIVYESFTAFVLSLFLFCLFAFILKCSRPFSVCFRQTPHTDGQWLCLYLYTITCHLSIILINWQLHVRRGRSGDLKKKCLGFFLINLNTVWYWHPSCPSLIFAHTRTHSLFFSRCRSSHSQFSHSVGIHWHAKFRWKR